MKENYETPVIKVINFTTADLLLMSGIDNEGIAPDFGGDDFE